jgi:serine/threonine protein kinase
MLSPGTLLQNRYCIKRHLARGGMGAVYEAEAIHLGRALVAVKETFFTSDWLHEQFEREAAMLARLRHAALPKVIDHFTEATGQFLVMEFIPGDELLDLLEQQLKQHGAPFHWTQVVEWAIKLLDALNYIHNQHPPVIHRDIKPQNLKLTPSGEIVLLDFGLAKDATTPTRPGGSVRGYTQDYASPEQLKFTGTDERSDLFSLGATLYHLMTGKPPVDAKVREEVISYAMPDPLRPAHQQDTEIPFAVAAVLARAMALDRDRRYASAAEMRQAFKQARHQVEAALVEEQRERQRRQPEPRRMEQERAPSETTKLDKERLSLPHALEEQQRVEVARQLAEQHQPTARQRAVLQIELGKLEEETLLRPARSSFSSPAFVSKPRARRIAVAVAALSLALIAYAAWRVIKPSGSSQPNQSAVAAKTASPATTLAEVPPQPARDEVLQYALEIEGEKARATSLDLASGKRFKLHFTPRTNGYLYLLAPGEDGRLNTFLTAQQIKAEADFVFPSSEDWINFSANSQRVPVTVVFATEPLARPSFLAKEAGRTLTADQQQAFELMRELAARSEPQTTVANGAQPAVSVSAQKKNQLLVFDIVFERRPGGN